MFLMQIRWAENCALFYFVPQKTAMKIMRLLNPTSPQLISIKNKKDKIIFCQEWWTLNGPAYILEEDIYSLYHFLLYTFYREENVVCLHILICVTQHVLFSWVSINVTDEWINAGPDGETPHTQELWRSMSKMCAWKQTFTPAERPWRHVFV